MLGMRMAASISFLYTVGYPPSLRMLSLVVIFNGHWILAVYLHAVILDKGNTFRSAFKALASRRGRLRSRAKTHQTSRR